MKSLLTASLLLFSQVLAAADTPAATDKPSTSATTASSAAEPGPSPDGEAPMISGEIAKRHQQARLEREIDRLQAQIEDIPADVDQRAESSRALRDELGYESWLLHQEGDEVRASIERLRVRLTLLESITRSQEQVDRVRLVELQNALSAINSDDRQVRDDQRRARERLANANLQISTRIATMERLVEVQRQLEALAPTPVTVIDPGPAHGDDQSVPAAPAPAANVPVNPAPAPTAPAGR